MQFDTKITGIPCQCEVISYHPAIPMRVTGPGMGDADPPEEAEFEYIILDRKGNRAKWLEAKITDQIDAELLEEYEAACTAEKYDQIY